MKLRALATPENRGWLSPAAWAVLVGYYPVRASYTYLKRLWRWKLLERQLDRRGLLLYRISDRGQAGLEWLGEHVRRAADIISTGVNAAERSKLHIGNDYFVSLDYYVRQGFAISGRFDRLNQQITGVGGVGKQNVHDWTVGTNKTLTASGNIIGRIAYSDLSGRDPVAAVKSTDRLVQADISFNF